MNRHVLSKDAAYSCGSVSAIGLGSHQRPRPKLVSPGRIPVTCKPSQHDTCYPTDAKDSEMSGMAQGLPAYLHDWVTQTEGMTVNASPLIHFATFVCLAGSHTFEDNVTTSHLWL